MRSYQSDRGRRGAALIIAIAIMTILLAIALTFFAVTRIELRTATNVTNTVRVELLAESGVAMGVATLNQDFLAHPAVSSIDHPWRSIYSGAAFAGKPWTWRGGVPLTAKGVPEIDLNLFPYVDVDGDGAPDEPLYRGPRTRNWLFIPRVENMATLDPLRPNTPVLYSPTADLYTADYQAIDLTNPGAGLPRLAAYRFFRYDDEHADNVESLPPELLPFATPKLYGPVTVPGVSQEVFDRDPDDQFYTKEMVDLWADVDNDGDGLKDSIWIPIPIDQFFPADGIDNDLDGYIDEQQDNRSDDDSDGFIEGIDTDGDGIPDDELDPDEAIEAGPFVYYTGGDGLDNDGDGFIDREDCPGCAKTFPDGSTREAQPPFEFDPLYDPLDPPTVLGSPGVSKLGFMLAAPLPGMRVKIDVNANGVVGDAGDVYYQEAALPGGGTEVRPFPAEIVLPPTITVHLRLVGGDTVPLIFTEEDVDTIDNDYDLLVNNFNVYAYLIGYQEPEWLDWRQPEWRPINDWRHNLTLCEEECQRRAAAENWTPAQLQACKDDCVTTHMPWFAQGADPFDVKLWLEEHDAAISLSYNEINTGRYFPELYEADLFPEAPDGAPRNPSTAYRLRITMTGEPACTLAGRAAILITDEQSKVNLNAAGAQTYDLFAGGDFQATGAGREALYRALADGVTPYEYETRALPDIGVEEAQHLWQFLTGAPKGHGLGVGAGDLDSEELPEGPPPLKAYHYDVSLPGYGRVDDNGNALLLSLNGINDNADRITPTDFDRPIADEGLRMPRLSERALSYLDPAFVAADLTPEVANELRSDFRSYTLRLGLLEGIDEPAELRQFRPLRNDLAEHDVGDIDAGLGGPLDNDSNEVANELGELGDRILRTREQIEVDVDGIGPVRFGNLKNLVSVHAADKNLKYYSTLSGIKTTNKVDLNLAPPQQIAATMLLQNTLDSPLQVLMDHPDDPGRRIFFIGEAPLKSDSAERKQRAAREGMARAFAGGLLQADTDVLAPSWDEEFDLPEGTTGGMLFTPDPMNGDHLKAPTWPHLEHRIPADPVLGAMQTAVDVVDSRDRDNSRSVLITERVDISPPELEEYTKDEIASFGGLVPVAWEGPTGPRDRVSDSDAMKLEEVQDYMADTLELANPPRLAKIDEWWRAQGNRELSAPEERRISYTVSGTEAVRINEIMVRPVRRVEAEATPDAANLPNPTAAPDPNRDLEHLYQLALDPSPYTFPLTKTPAIDESPEYWNGQVLAGMPADGDPANPVISELPEFIMQRHDMSWDLIPRPGPAFVEQWNLTGSAGQLGSGAELWTEAPYTSGVLPSSADFRPAEHVPNAVEYLFVASDGLPEGRYYLSANTIASWLGGDITISRDRQLRYAIKYVPVEFSDTGQIRVLGNTILQDVGQIAVDANTNIPNFDTISDWWEQWQEGALVAAGGPPPLFAPVTTDRMADPTQRQPEGWKFLDGSEAPFAKNPDFPGYFERGLSETGDPRMLALAPLIDPVTGEPLATTNTVVVPPPPMPARIDPVTGDALAPEPGWALCVSLMMDLQSGYEEQPWSLAVNAFEFSQEPDHEWVELINVSDEPVDIGGWELEIGIPDAAGAAPDPNKVVLTIPLGSTIAPSGTVLLTTSKFDYFQRLGSDSMAAVDRNGIGLARGVLPLAELLAGRETAYDFVSVTTPVMADIAALRDPGSDPLYDVSGSPFVRISSAGYTKFLNEKLPTLLEYWNPPESNPKPDFSGFDDEPGLYSVVDYLDSNGNGLNDLADPSESTYPPDASMQSSPDTTPGLVDPNAPWSDRAWDRIVQVAVSGVTAATREDMIQLVLRGGIFPNYPEQDGIDNDGDGPFSTSFDEARPGALGALVIENDPGNEADNELLYPGDLVDNDMDGFIDEFDEGVDEGRSVMAGSYGLGNFGAGTIPVSFFNTGGVPYEVAIALSGAGGIDAHEDSTADEDGLITRLGYDTAAYDEGDLTGAAPYLGTDVDTATGEALDPPAWKAFVQRRWYPGDNVVVTLYEGQASQGRVADRVTYNELDVINRSVDDIRLNPYPVGLNPNYPTLWPANHMGLDFYKSLERKHPLYNGDRFGTQNRWQATDGSYDDWADSLLPWQRLTNKEVWPYRPLAPSGTPVDAHLYRFDPDLHPDVLAANQQLLRHAMSGSPLRYNYTHRVAINPTLGVAKEAGEQFTVARDFQLPWGKSGWVDTPLLMPNPDWGLLEAEVRDGGIASTGDLLRLPHPTFEMAMFNALEPGFPSGISFLDYGSNVNVVSAYPPDDVNYLGLNNFHEDRTLRTAVLGQAIPESGTEAVLAQAADSAAFSPLTLTMAQANFTAIGPFVFDSETPEPADIQDGDVKAWYRWKMLGTSVQAPRGWAPVYLFGSASEERPKWFYAAMPGFDSSGEQVPLDQWPFLLNPVFFLNNNDRWTDPLTSYSLMHFIDRWPLEKRIIGFISDRFDPEPESDIITGGPRQTREILAAPDALFEWGPEDGLENGDYVVYIGTFIPGILKTLAQTNANVVNLAGAYAAGSDVLAAKLTGVPDANALPSWLARMTGPNPVPATVYGDTFAEDGTALGLPVGPVLPDPVSDGTALSQDPRLLAIEVAVITDRTRAGNLPAKNWGHVLQPNPDGYVLYTDKGQSNWQPLVVEVRNNYLAIRVRNVSPPGRPVLLTHVVLAPRRNTPGRINVNTADMSMRIFSDGDKIKQELFNPLMGLPGMIDAITTAVYPANAADEFKEIDLPTLPLPEDHQFSPLAIRRSPSKVAFDETDDPNPFAEPSLRVPPARVKFDNDGNQYDATVLTDSIRDAANAPDRTAALQLSAMIAEGRPEHADGRYYENPVQLAINGSAYLHPNPPVTDLAGYIFPLSNADDPQVRFQQMADRFRRMANMLTTRSDLYEIIVTAQSGYGLDMDGDGFINYRSNDEFVTTAESKVRSVYERRSPRPNPAPPE